MDYQDVKKAQAWFQGWAVTRKGGPGSGHWGHLGGTGGPGHPGGSQAGGGMIFRPNAYLNRIRTGLREKAPVMVESLDAIQKARPDLERADAEQYLFVMGLDKETFTRYADKLGIPGAEDLAKRYFAEEKEIDRTIYRKQMEIQRKATCPVEDGHPLGVMGISEDLEKAAEKGLVGKSVDEAGQALYSRFGIQLQRSSQYDAATAHKEASWLLNMADQSPELAAVLKKQVKIVSFQGQKSGTAAMRHGTISGKDAIIVCPTLHSPSMWVHEAGHAAEAFGRRTGKVNSEKWNRFGVGRIASFYGFANPSEDFAEAWTAMAGGLARKQYKSWNPQNAAIMDSVIQELLK